MSDASTKPIGRKAYGSIVAYDQTQTRIFHIQTGSVLPLPHLRARAVTGCASPFICRIVLGANPLRSKALQHQTPVHVSSPAGLVHQLDPFVNSLRPMVQELSGRRLTIGQKRTSDSAKND